MANANIFQQYLKPVRSVEEYSADLDKAEANKLSLQDARLTTAEKQRTITEANAFKAALADTDPNTPEGLARLRAISPTAAMTLQKQLQELEASKAKIARDNAGAGKDTAQGQRFTYDLESAKRLETIREWTSAPTRQAAIDTVRRAVSSGQISMDVATQALANMPANDAEWPAYARQKQLELLPIDKQFAMRVPKPLPAVNTGGTSVIPMQNQMDGTITQGASFQRTVSPDAQLQANTSISNTQANINANAPVRNSTATLNNARSVFEFGATPQGGGTVPGNNFGNIRPVGGGPDSGFQTFGTPQEGLQAVQQNLMAYGRQGINTIERIISTWAPPTDKNDTPALIRNASQLLRVAPNQQLDMNNPATINALTTAIVLQEHGPRVFAGGGAPSPQPQAPAPAAPQAPAVDREIARLPQRNAQTQPQTAAPQTTGPQQPAAFQPPERMQGEPMKAYLDRVKTLQAASVRGAASNPAAKPMPMAAVKEQNDHLEAIGISGGIKADLGAVLKQLNDGKLNPGMINNLVAKGRNAMNMSDEESRNLVSFKATLEKLRNDSLRLNKGVQTDGDAQRAWNELLENINDKGVVKQRLEEINRLNERAIQLRRLQLDQIRGNFGRESLDTSRFEQQPAAVGNPGFGPPPPGAVKRVN